MHTFLAVKKKVPRLGTFFILQHHTSCNTVHVSHFFFVIRGVWCSKNVKKHGFCLMFPKILAKKFKKCDKNLTRILI